MMWARPDLVALLLLIPVVAMGGVYGLRARARLLSQLAAAEVLVGLLPPGVTRARAWQAVLGVVAVAGLAVAAAGPRYGFDWQQQKVEGIAMVVVLDVSRSMDAADVPPSRLERARREVVDLVGYLRGDSVGLVIFAAGPYVRIPLTVDYDTFLWALNDSETGTIRAQGTALAGAIDAARGLLGKAEGSGKAIVLVSDGELHDDDAALDAALASARDAGIRIYAVGIGDPAGAPIPLPEGGFKKDADGNVVLSRLEEGRLQRVASETGGAYVRAVPSDEDVRTLYQAEIRGKLAVAERGVRREKVWRERFQWPLAVGLVAMVASAALGIGRRQRRSAVAGVTLLLLASLLLPGPAWAGAAEEGAAALRAEQWKKAAERLGQARVEAPEDRSVAQGLAQALYRAGRYRESEQIFDTLAEQDPANRAVHLYNAGNAAYRGGRLAESLQSFEAAAKADPKLAAARTNAGAVQKEILARLQEDPPEQQAEDGAEGGEGEASPAAEGAKPQEGQESSDRPPGDEPGAESEAQPPAGGEEAGAEPGAADGAEDQGVREPSPGTAGPETENPGTARTGEGVEEPLSTEEGTDATGGIEEEGAKAGGMTREQAVRLLDAVPDGKPRVVVGGRATERDW